MTFPRHKDNQDNSQSFVHISPDWYHTALGAAFSGWVGATVILVWLLTEKAPALPLLGQFWLSLLPLHIVAFLGAIMVLLKKVPSSRILLVLNLEKPRYCQRRIIGFSLLAVLAFYPVSALVNHLTQIVLWFTGYEAGAPPLGRFLENLDDFPLLLSMVVGAVLIAPIVEEVLFRLVIFENLRFLGFWPAAFLVAGAFALLHGTVSQAPALFLLGLLLQYSRRRYKTLWAPISLHAIFNAAAVFLAWYVVTFTDIPLEF
ncbi:MAG: type II CAAX endopeptidase family protein [Lentisphaeria bacterium]